uniref:Ubiquitin carboxyl-terminal hydrolase n=1 Tax=Strongyloides stercoralis TaxID=6248 RepID=A0A0K0E262_STRER
MDNEQMLIHTTFICDKKKNNEIKIISKKDLELTKNKLEEEENEKLNINFEKIAFSIYTNQLIMEKILKYINCYSDRKKLESICQEIKIYSRNVPCQNFKKLGNKRFDELFIDICQSNFLLHINGIYECFNLDRSNIKRFTSEYNNIVDFILHFSKKIKHFSLHINKIIDNSYILPTSSIIYNNLFNFLPKNLYTTSLKYTHIREDNKKYFFLLIRRQFSTNMCLHSCHFHSDILKLSSFKMPKFLNLFIHLQNPLSEVGIFINKCGFVQNLFIFIYLRHDEGFIEEDWKNLLVASKNITTSTFSIYILCDCHNENCYYYTTIPQYIYNNGSTLMKSNGKEKFKLEYLTISNINHKIKCKVCKK